MKKMRLVLTILLFILLMPIMVNAEALFVTDCDNNKLYTTMPSDLKGLAKIMAENAYLDNGKSEHVNSCSGVKFDSVSSNYNGKGIYEIASTKDDAYPIFYYRGAVDNNNVKFAGYCWKAIRTTDTGGVKLLYNGNPDENGYCTNTTGESTQIGKSKFNINNNSPSDVGYMYGERYTSSFKPSSELNSPYVYGNDVVYSEGKYTLIDTVTMPISYDTDRNILNNNHYTCFSTENTCSRVYYIYFIDSNYPSTYFAHYITLTDGKKVEDALDEMFDNKNDSAVKIYIDNWYSQNLTSYTPYIEDTIYCNDRSISDLSGWNPDGGNTKGSLRFGGNSRSNNHNPSLECSRKIDRFTVSSTKGNGKLTYPIGLITNDEVMYAGGESSTMNEVIYLNTELYYSSATPAMFENMDQPSYISTPHDNYANNYTMGKYGIILSDRLFEDGVRPVISLSPTMTIVSSGNGTSTDPYVIDQSAHYSIHIEENEHTKETYINEDNIEYVESGKTIIFKITSKKGYEIESIKVIGANKEIPFYTTGNENEYTFIMPDTDVTIKPTHKKVIINPHTGDKLYLVVLLMAISVCLGIITYKKKESKQ